MNDPRPYPAVDPVTQEILQGKLLAVVDEMGIVLARSSMSPVVYEVLDFACGLCTVAGDLIAQTNGITLFTGTFSTQVRALRDRFGADMAPGDVFMTNDPYNGGTHGCDCAVVRPMFDGVVPVGYAITVAHWLDVGGAVPGSLPANASEIYQEGLRLPGVRVMRADRLVDDIVAIIRENVRLPELALGDLNAQLAAARIAERRIQEICTKYGSATLATVFDGMLASSERQARAAVRALPDGRYAATDFIDGDGRSDERIPVNIVVIIDGDTMTFGYTGSAPARDAPINCSVGALQSAVKTVFKAMIAPQAPSNDGWFRPVRVIVPSGTVFSAVKPSSTGWYYEGSAQASELAWKALAPIAPERFSAGSYMSLCATYFCGTLPDGGGQYVHIEPQHGGWGATAGRDGANALIAVTDGDTFNYPAELLEAKFPLRIVRHALNVEDGAGAGQWRGGFGVVREYEVLAEGSYLYASYGRSQTRPWGFAGGHDGSTNYIEVIGIGGTTAKCGVVHAGMPRLTTEYRLERTRTQPGYPVQLPVVDIVEIGAGGGSIAWFDEGGALRVGPASAGAAPGPACYGFGGTDPTITDAMLIVGVLDRDSFAGGSLRLDVDAAIAAMARIASRLGDSVEATANAVIRIAEANMLNALKLVTIQRGHDPRDLTLVASGGGGPIHAARLARELGVRRLVIPPYPGVFSAWGMLVSAPRRDVKRTRLLAANAGAVAAGQSLFADMEREAAAYFGVEAGALRYFHAVEMRYRGQEHTVAVTCHLDQWNADALLAAFHEAHEQAYTFRLDTTAAEVVSFHLKAELVTPRPTLVAAATAPDAGTAAAATRCVDHGTAGRMATPVRRREALAPGHREHGPLLIEESSSTTVVLPGQRVTMDAGGLLLIEEHA